VRRLLVLLAIVPSLLVASAAAGATGPVSLKRTKGVEFPDRAFVLRLPQGFALEPGALQVLENGEPVSKVAVTPASSVRDERQYGTVLLIDASNSMRGEPIAAAAEAARAFARRRNFNQALAVVAFNDRTVVSLPFTTDGEEIAAAVAEPPTLRVGTRLFDGVAAAAALLDRERIRSGSIVLLSDGADTGGGLSEEAAIRRANAAGARVFSVGLVSKQFAADPLRRLAAATGGSYAEARSGDDLAKIYDALGYQLANEYLLEYRSLAEAGRQVEVSVRVRGLDDLATTSYRSPPLAAPAPSVFHPSALDRVLQSSVTMALLALLLAGLLGITAVAALMPRRSSVTQRLGAFVSVARPDSGKRQTAVLSERLLEGTERSFGRTPWWLRFREELEIAQITMPPEQIVVLTAMATILCFWVLSLVVPLLFAVFALLIPFAVVMVVRSKADRSRRAFTDQLPDNLQVLSSALRAGHSLVGALAVVVDDAPEPSRREFRRVVADEQLGVLLEDALANVARRMRSRDLDQVALVAALQRQTGGNSAEVLDRVADTIRERAALRRLVRTLTAQGRLARWVVTALPVSLVLLISVINRDYLSPLFSHGSGQVLVAVAAVMVVAGSLVIRRIVDIRV
jgi:tight adherence protein B